MNKKKDSCFRVMWLLNHTSARKFEIPMMRSIGIEEIFTPKIYPQNPSFRSASTDYSGDENLTIPQNVLERFNSINWYEHTDAEDWILASEYFDVCIFILQDFRVFNVASKHFSGALLWRAYGLNSPLSHGRLINYLSKGLHSKSFNRLGSKFYFAKAYDNLDEIEPSYISNRSLYLPLGMHSVEIVDEWIGDDKKILFVCPDIKSNDYYKNIYKNFSSNFKDFPYVVAGAQSIPVEDSRVLGFIPLEMHQSNMKHLGLMFYHSQEKHHIHYHPFEAIKAGMPLIYMAGGMLDRLGGDSLPGRCVSIDEARKKIKKILAGDSVLIQRIKSTQIRILDCMDPKNLRDHWVSGFEKIKQDLEKRKLDYNFLNYKKKIKISVVLPVEYKGGSLRGALLFAEALRLGAIQSRDAAEIIFCHIDKENYYKKNDFRDVNSEIKIRPFKWKYLDGSTARRAMKYSGYLEWEPLNQEYCVVDDGINYLEDCDAIVIISDRLGCPLLPNKPTVYMVYDYLQRYIPLFPNGADQIFLDAVRSAEKVITTTDFTFSDVLEYAGVERERIVKLPMLVPDFSNKKIISKIVESDYFIWTTNKSIHKNHLNALEALHIYYSELNGQLTCEVTGVASDDLFDNPYKEIRGIVREIKSSNIIMNKIRLRGNLSDSIYQELLSSSAFLWHAARLDNGTFSVLEAAGLGIPSLSSDYPAMREIDENFSLDMSWMDPDDPYSMAFALKNMESNYIGYKKLLLSTFNKDVLSIKKHAQKYWETIKSTL